MNGPPALLRRSRPPRRPPVSVPDASKKTSGATCPTKFFSANYTPMPPLHPRRLAPYADADTDAPPAVSDASADIFQQASPICAELAMAGSWTTMMSHETDVDEISLPMPLHDLGTQTKVTKAKRAGNYTLEEDIQLCMSWRTSAQILLFPMSSQGGHTGKGLQITIMPTRPLSLTGIQTLLSTVGVPFKRIA